MSGADVPSGDEASRLTAADPAARTSRLRDLVGRPWFWAAFVAVAFSWPIARALFMWTRLPDPPPVIGQVPDFELVDQNGRPFRSEDQRGRIWVAGFMFTRCPSICPALTARMLEIHRRSRNAGAAFHLVSFSVDPLNDTPEVLLEYARERQVRLQRWSFVTGPPEEIRRVATEGMKILVGDAGPDVPPESVVHGTHLVLVDQELRIRGYFDSADPERIDELLRQVHLLVNRPVTRSGGRA